MYFMLLAITGKFQEIRRTRTNFQAIRKHAESGIKCNDILKLKESRKRERNVGTGSSGSNLV
jgi:hypothetical protein